MVGKKVNIFTGDKLSLPGRGRALSVTRTIDVYEESSYYQRSTSLPRHADHPYEVRKTTAVIRKHTDSLNESFEKESQCSSSKEIDEMEMFPLKRSRYNEKERNVQKSPTFTKELPKEIIIRNDEDLRLNVGIKSYPQADIRWDVNGFELKDSKRVTVINEEDQSTLIVKSPVRSGRYSVFASNEYGKTNQVVRVIREEEERYVQTEQDEIVYQHAYSSPPEFASSSVSVRTSNPLSNKYKIIDEQKRSNTLVNSVETVKYVESPGEVIQSKQEISSGLSSTTIYKAVPPQPLPKPKTPVIHEPQRDIVSETPYSSTLFSHAGKYIAKHVDETGTDKNTCIFSLQPDAYKLSSVVSITEQKYDKSENAENETLLQRVPPPKPPPPIKVMENDMLMKRTFHSIKHRTAESLPKAPMLLKKLESEIRLKAGEKLVLELKVASSPESQFKWYQNNFEIKSSPFVIFETPAINESRVTFIKPTSGTYRVVAANTHGSCSSSTRVIAEVIEEWTSESNVFLFRSVPERHEPKYQLVKRLHTEVRNDLPKAPKIIEGFAPIMQVPKNAPLILRVVADALPKAEFRWLLNNFEVRNSKTTRLEHPAPNVSQITFETPVSGRYEVVAINHLGQDSCSGKVIINYEEELQTISFQRPSKPIVPRVPVFLKSLPTEMQLNRGQQEIKLTVSAQGEQPITFRWFADGSLLSNSVQHQIINEQESSTLLVRKMIEFDVVYAVEVSNVNGAVWSETTLKPSSSVTSYDSKLTELEEIASLESTDLLQRSPRFINTLVDINLQQNNSYSIRVTVDTESAPCEFVWLLNGRDVRTIPGFSIDSSYYESTLYIKAAMPKYSGKLLVSARNKYGSVKSSSVIIVQATHEELYNLCPEEQNIPIGRPPQIIIPLQPLAVQADQRMRICCRIDGLPQPEVFWTKDDILLDEWQMNKGIIARTLPDGTCELIYQKCGPEDAGLYMLTARNIYGTTSTSAYVHVAEKTEQTATETKETVTETKETVTEMGKEIEIEYCKALKPQFEEVSWKQNEDKVILTCKLISKKAVQVFWYKDNQRLYQSYKYRMDKISENMHTLTICNFDKWDEGPYTCRIQNEYGSTETNIDIRSIIESQKVEKVVEETISKEIRLKDEYYYQKKEYSDTPIELKKESQIDDIEETFSHSAELRKTEEQYKLLVKVAEILASKLVANVVIDEAINTALKRMNRGVHSSEEEEFESAIEFHPFPPRCYF
ncbi:unnamed protein product [Thelazia callipaeda]|uniref:Ig-like domain-containing protein n=1 Tax=Thelazia callipaeda TaxID=103827 RepID=A0A0N5CS22_THECL|nr:unnamed protein product [Thelazia callipaeda]